MRILITTDTVGGVWTFTLELVAGLLEYGCQITLVSLGRSPSIEQQAWVNTTRQDFPGCFKYIPLDFPLEWMEDNHASFEGPARALCTAAADLRPHLLHTSQYCFGALDIGIPILVTAHSDVYSWAQACGESFSEDTVWLYTYRKLVQDGLSKADAVVAPTSWMLQALSHSFQLPAHKRVIANGRTLQPKSGHKRKMQALTVGRLWDKAKNTSDLTGLRSPLPIIVAGDTTFGTNKIHTEDALDFRGTLDTNELRSLFSVSAIYICTSLYEPFGLAPLEAAQCGCAVVARDIPSLREVWENSALYYSDATSLSSLLEKLHNNPAMLASARKRSYQRARTFSAATMVDAYIAAYETLLQPTLASHYVA